MIASIADLLAFLGELERAKIHYSLEHNRDESVMVLAAVPGERWEVEFFEDGHLEIEIFRSDGAIRDQEALKDLFARHSC